MEPQKKPEAPYAPAAAEKKWQVLYPVYLDKNRSVAEGRRVPQSAALSDPKVEEMAMVRVTRVLRSLCRCLSRH